VISRGTVGSTAAAAATAAATAVSSWSKSGIPQVICSAPATRHLQSDGMRPPPPPSLPPVLPWRSSVCPRGFYEPAANATRCLRCDANSFCPGGDKVESPSNRGSRVECGTNLITRNTGARTQADCGEYLQASSTAAGGGVRMPEVDIPNRWETFRQTLLHATLPQGVGGGIPATGYVIVWKQFVVWSPVARPDGTRTQAHGGKRIDSRRACAHCAAAAEVKRGCRGNSTAGSAGSAMGCAALLVQTGHVSAAAQNSSNSF
jgi:hypothetical protein